MHRTQHEADCGRGVNDRCQYTTCHLACTRLAAYAIIHSTDSVPILVSDASFLAVSVSVCLYVCLCLSVCLSVCLSLSLSLSLSVCLFVCLPCQSPSLCQSVSLFVCRSICLSVSLSRCVPASFSLSPSLLPLSPLSLKPFLLSPFSSLFIWVCSCLNV